MVRREYAQQMKLDTTNEQADGKFVEEYLSRFPLKSVAKVNKFLYVHN
jgi:hypothetical protein